MIEKLTRYHCLGKEELRDSYRFFYLWNMPPAWRQALGGLAWAWDVTNDNNNKTTTLRHSTNLTNPTNTPHQLNPKSLPSSPIH